MNYHLDRCGCCGACVAVCIHRKLILEEFRIIILNDCLDCGNCQEVCPTGAMDNEDEI